eukprot:jgi/Picre1/29767/NNA_005149.t1
MIQSTEGTDGFLDLTNSHLHELEGQIVVPEDTVHVDLTANRLSRIESCILNLPKLETLSLRQNILKDASSISMLKNAKNLKIGAERQPACEHSELGSFSLSRVFGTVI